MPHYHFLHKDIQTDSRRFQLQINSENIQKLFNQEKVIWGRIIYESHVPSTLLPGILFLPPSLCLSSLNNLAQYVKCLILKSLSEQFTGMYKVHTLDEIPLQQTESGVCARVCVCAHKLFRLCSLQHREGLNSRSTCTGNLLH